MLTVSDDFRKTNFEKNVNNFRDDGRPVPTARKHKTTCDKAACQNNMAVFITFCQPQKTNKSNTDANAF